MPGIVMDPLNIAGNLVGNVSKAKSHREKVSAAEALVRDILSFASRQEIISSEHALIAQLGNPACQKADKEAILLGTGAFLKALWIANDIALTACLFPAIPHMLDTIGDKNAALKDAAVYAMESISGFLRDSGSELDEILVGEFASQFLNFLKGKNARDTGVVTALKCVSQMTTKALEEEEGVLRKQMTRDLEAYFVAVEGYLHHLKALVSKQATKTLKDLTQLVDNTDIKRHIPKLVDTLKEPTMQNLQSAVHDLCQTTFIQPVLTDLLALVAPILERTLAMPQMPQDYIRDTVVVVENLAKLVYNPLDAKQFLPRLLPGIDKAKEYSAIPQVREVAATASGTVRRVLGHVGEDLTQDGVISELTAVLNAEAPSYLTGDNAAAWNLATRDMVSRAVKLAFESSEMKRIPGVIETILSNPKSKAQEVPFLEIGEKVSQNLAAKYLTVIEAEDEDEGVPIVDSVFSLAYGGMLLLNHSQMRLLKGHRYGICGKNGAGKSTLMRAIAEGSLEGFPTKDELKRCFVEFKAEDKFQTVYEYMVNQLTEEGFAEVAKNEERVRKVLTELGFEGERMELDVNSLSGGWKMKLSLGKAILMEADVLLLDEPTNHLDTANVSWLQNYLVTHTDITSMIISHDRDFLDFVCTDIINYENKKLVYYKGNLSNFIEKNADAGAFVSLDASESKFNFPDPGILTGVKSTTRAIMKMSNVTFTYPGGKSPSLMNATCAITLSSRVGIKGANGAGKSTLIRLLMGELIPQSGNVEKHPNLRIGYVAQHSLKHVEMHLEKSPLQYLIWRYENGDDREANMKATRVFTDEDLVQMETQLEMGNGKGKGQIECIVGRQKSKKSFQYEIKWKNFLPRWNTKISRETLIEKGFAKLVQEFDDKESAREGLGFRELKPDIIRKHFEDVGLDPDIAEHNEIGGLSGGQKVKVVIAAAMWVKPHVLILDEPTNFLDRDTLGGLSHAIKGFKGGVVMISHNDEFMQTLMNDFWLVENHRVQTSKLLNAADNLKSALGTPNDSAASSDAEAGDSDMSFKTKAPKKKKLTRNQIKEQQVRRKLRYISWLQSPKGTPMPKDSDDES